MGARSLPAPTETPRPASHLESQLSPGLRKCRAPGRPQSARTPDAGAERRTEGRAASPRAACVWATAGRAAGPGGHFESERAAARWLRGHEVGRRAAGSAELLLAPAGQRGPEAASSESALGPGVLEAACGGLTPNIRYLPALTFTPHLDRPPSPLDPVPKAAVTFRAAKEKAAEL